MKELMESLLQAQALSPEAAEQILQHHDRALGQLRFEALLEKQIREAGGRNQKAITALLDTRQLQESQEQESAVTQALEALKKECGYLFAQQQPPYYAGGTGTQMNLPRTGPANLAEALRQRFEGK